MKKRKFSKEKDKILDELLYELVKKSKEIEFNSNLNEKIYTELKKKHNKKVLMMRKK